MMKVLYTSTDTDVDGAVGRLLDNFPWRKLLPQGQDVLIKVNLTWDYLRPGVNTSPWVVEALCRRLKEHTGQIYLGESSQVLVNASKALRVQRMDAVVERQVGSCDGVENVCISPLTEVPSFNFKQAEPNFVAKVEKKIRGKRKQQGSQKDGPFIGIMKTGAKRWYNLSYSIFGQKREAEEWKKNLTLRPSVAW
ncbi:MAG: DUF362 domain-containing protein [Candidatus Sabulitectum sp.]|nr:DUF362 domain-containing protein [Candidatus Sabulitectum sp.]